MTKAVAWQLKAKGGSWGPPTKSKDVADGLVREGFEKRCLIVQDNPPDFRRAEFEHSCLNHPYGSFSITRDHRLGREDGYISSHTEIMWLTWKAAVVAQGYEETT